MRICIVALVAGVAGVLSLTAGTAEGQTRAVTLEVEPDDVGVDGLSQPGAWTPLRARLTNQTADYREVVLQWTLPDADGDRVRFERPVALNPSATVAAWTYGAMPIAAVPTRPYTVRALDGETGVLLDETRVAPGRLAEVDRPVIGIFGGSGLGLGFAQSPATRHEVVRLHPGLEMHRLPDRWHGLSMFHALVWCDPGGSPTDTRVSAATLTALARWVERGGHLVLLWPATGQTWTDTPLADLLPFDKDDAVRVRKPAPAWLVQPTPETPLDYHVFRVRDEPGVAVLRSDAPSGAVDDPAGRPVIVARAHGFGRVTVIGLDWSQPALRALGIPRGRITPWHAVFGWTSPALTEDVIERDIANNDLVRPSLQNPISLGGVFARRIAMRETAGPALLAAVVVFLVYWLVAGPLADMVLGKRGLARYRWVGFAAAAVAFTAVSWGGAYLARPGTTRLAHVSVLDARPGEGTARVTSFVSAFIPRFGRAALELAPGLDEADNDNLLTTAGVDRPDGGATGFLDPQAYTMDAARPADAAVPVRSTAKSLRLDFQGPLLAASAVDDREPVGVDWAVPRPVGDALRLEGFWPVGTLRHGLPAPLRDVRVVYCPGGGEAPFVWRIRERWPADEPLDLTDRPQVDRLVVTPSGGFYPQQRNFKGEGLLGKRLDPLLGGGGLPLAGAGPAGVADATVIEHMEILSFFDRLPPPDFRDTRSLATAQFGVLRRPVGRRLDLSALTMTRCVILLGHLPQSPLPAPLTVAGRTPPSNGWTTVRCVFDVE